MHVHFSKCSETHFLHRLERKKKYLKQLLKHNIIFNIENNFPWTHVKNLTFLFLLIISVGYYSYLILYFIRILF